MKCDEDHRNGLIKAYDRMVECEDKSDEEGFYTSIFMFAEIGLDSTKNQVLSHLLYELLPTIRRLQYITIKMKTGDLKQNTSFFKTILTCLETKNIELGEKSIRDYIRNETEFALEAIRTFEYKLSVND